MNLFFFENVQLFQLGGGGGENRTPVRECSAKMSTGLVQVLFLAQMNAPEQATNEPARAGFSPLCGRATQR